MNNQALLTSIRFSRVPGPVYCQKPDDETRVYFEEATLYGYKSSTGCTPTL